MERLTGRTIVMRYEGSFYIASLETSGENTTRQEAAGTNKASALCNLLARLNLGCESDKSYTGLQDLLTTFGITVVDKTSH
jgi:hypothetical protein